MKRAIFILSGILVLVVTLVVAQESTLGLSASDYDLFSAANGAQVKSFGFDYTAHLVIDGLDTFAVNADVNGSGAEDMDAHALDVSLNGNILLGTTQKITPQVESRWVDNKLYFNPGDGWQAQDGASQFVSDHLSQIAVLNADPTAIAKWDWSGIDGLDDVLGKLKAIPAASFLSVQRLDDETVGDVKTAHFQIKADLHGMMASDAFVDVVAALSSAEGTPWNIMYNHAQLAKIVQDNNALFENVTLTLDQYVGTDDKLIHRAVVSLNMPLDPTKLGYVDKPFTASTDLDVTFKNLNQPQTIAAPDGAKTVDSFALLPEAALQPAGADVTQYSFLETVGENATYTKDFEAQAGDKVTISVRGIGLDFDPNTALLSADGTRLAENEDHEQAYFGLDTYDAQIADFAIPANGTYSAEVTEYYQAAGSFVLTITIKR